jgi:hypothetical protein
MALWSVMAWALVVLAVSASSAVFVMLAWALRASVWVLAALVSAVSEVASAELAALVASAGALVASAGALVASVAASVTALVTSTAALVASAAASVASATASVASGEASVAFVTLLAARGSAWTGLPSTAWHSVMAVSAWPTMLTSGRLLMGGGGACLTSQLRVTVLTKVSLIS